ncbi:CDP-2,3-bis-(O-geranylgeranyl)-sn-glycerol synthase [Natranaeroarchaeum aerophilus]|uniref:CDP-archaeol synthase n=1 Tax=Natranaeroarchaeum aerophilus TaxID=2917711 RepID=A0AAE3FP55_9EURY|nr:CDP-2,3-bis-(O-geranylgeranyl)-sn-glycerol synthase [Natranaeroarchaeum aerophilus]MCL9813047.1 CDP-2,3-bis-(O-geranylgeranyl)-sn-glycerol synthase [Natranaeroarchaeum aerophilus]
MNPLEIVVVAFWLMLPAYVPNNAAVLTGGGPPIDGGRTWDGKRVLGDGKTWRGTAGGILAGVGLGLLLNFLAEGVSSALGFTVAEFPIVALLALAAGAMLGDILASFLKRRTGRERGAAFPGIDQLDFVVVSLVLTALVATDWFVEWFTLPVILAVLILTPVLHVGTNIIAFKLGLKDEPW